MNFKKVLLYAIFLIVTVRTCPAAPRPVKIAPLAQDQTQWVQFYGLLRGGKQTTLSFRVPGQLTRLDAEEGQKVEKGQVLASLSAGDIDAQAGQADAGVVASKAQYEQAKREYERYEPLYRSGAISKSQFEQVQTGLKMAQAGYRNALAQRDRAGLAQKDTVLTAPFDGTVTSLLAQQYSHLAPDAPVMTLESLSGWQVETPLPPSWRQTLRIGQKAHVTVEALPDEVFEATLTRMASRAKAGTQTWEALWTLAPTSRPLLPGAAVSVTPVEVKSSALALPASALFSDNGGTAIWIVTDGKIKRTPVEVKGFTRSGEALIQSAEIKAGDSAVVAGVNDLTDGQEVRPLGGSD